MKQHAFYSQIISQDIASPISLENLCFLQHNTCTLENLGNGVCDTACNNNHCAYDLGDCGHSCESGCNKCFEENGKMQCLECAEDYYQLYTLCLSECVSGFIPTIKFNRKVCDPLQDESDISNPSIIYVSQDRSLNSSLQTGDFLYPFSSFIAALSLIRNRYNKVYLMNFDGSDHILDSMNMTDFPDSRFSKEGSPLDYSGIGFWKKIEILPLYCSNNVTWYCYSQGQKARIRWKGIEAIQLYVFKIMDIRDVEFDGYNLITDEDCPDSEISCTYCPFIRYDTDLKKYYDDKDQEVNWKYALKSDCDRYKDFSLFKVEGYLRLTRVNFVNWRAGFFSLIKMTTGSLYLREVDFINIKANQQPYSAIITSYKDENETYANNLVEYYYGNIKLLNNGYEYNDSNYFSGFFYGKGINQLIFQNLNFEQNLVYKGKSVQSESSDNISSLIYLENFAYLQMEFNSFRYNIVDKLIYLKMLPSSDSIFISSVLLQFKYEHILIKNNQFSNIFGDILYYNFYILLPNINLLGNTFESIVFDNNLIYIGLVIYDPVYFDYQTGNFQSGLHYDIPLMYRFIRLNGTSVISCYGPGSIIHMQNLINVTMNSLSITHSLQNPSYDLKTEIIQDIVYRYFINQGNYISETFNSKQLTHSQKHYGNACYFYSIAGFTSDHLILSDNYSGMGGTDVLFLNTLESFHVNRIDITNNSANSQSSGTGLSFSKTSIKLELENVTAKNNINYIGYGTLYFENFNTLDSSTFTIKNSYFFNNSAGYGSAIAISASNTEIKNVRFEGNIVTNSYGAAIYFNQHTSPVDSLLTILNCEFSNNVVKSGLGGAVAIDNSLNIRHWKLKLDFKDNLFHNNTSLNDASNIFISNEVYLHQDSIVQNCEFKYNKSERKGNILLAYRSGVLTFDKCRFDENESSQGIVMYIILSQNTLQNSCRVVIQNSSFRSNRAINSPYASLIHAGDSIFHSTLETYNNTFEVNSCTSVNVDYGKWIGTNCTFINNQVTQAAVGTVSNGGIAELTDMTILDNISTLKGGLFLLTSKAVLKVRNSAIRRNTSYQDGGVVFMDNESIIMFENSEITQNQAMKKGSFIYSTECNIQGSYILNSRLSRNISKKGGVISLLNSILNISASEIYGNIDEEITPGIILAFSTLNAQLTRFYDQTGIVGSGIYATSQSEVLLDNCTFDNLHTINAGATVVGYYSKIRVHNSRFKNLFGGSAGSILAYSDCKVEITDSEFKNSTSSFGGGIIKSFESEITIRNSIFDKFNPTGIEAEKLTKFNISDSIFQNGSGDAGGVIFCTTCSSIDISNSQFVNNTASYGGAIYITSAQDSPEHSPYIFSSNIFTHNSAQSGGSIYSDNLNLSFYNNTFLMNKATLNEEDLEGNGGAVKIQCYETPGCVFNFTENTFISNSASREGGGISWKHFAPVMVDNIFQNNSAQYGNDTASFAYQFAILENNTDTNIHENTDRSVINYYMLSEIAPGQPAETILIALVDNYGHIVTTDSSSTAELLSDDEKVTLSGEIRKKADKGYFEFNDFIISGTPQSRTVISVHTSDGIQTTNLKTQDTRLRNQFYIGIRLRECLIGEKESDQKCIPCPEETYSFDPDDGTCKVCPEEAVCYGGYTMTPKKGYWRSDKFSEIFLECPYRDACIGSPEYPDLDLTGSCEKGYKGNLCNSCEKNYSETIKNRCEICSSSSMDYLKAVGIIGLVIIVFSFVVKTTLNSAYKPKSLQAIYIKIFLNYIQLVTLTSNLDLNWPELTLKFLYYQEEAGSVNEQLFSFDCLINHYDDRITHEEIYYIKVVAVLLSPIIIICVTFMFWLLIAIYKISAKPLKQEFVSTIIILLFLVHPNIVKQLFSTFSCMEFEPGEYWIRGSYDIRCWDDKHWSYIL